MAVCRRSYGQNNFFLAMVIFIYIGSRYDIKNICLSGHIINGCVMPHLFTHCLPTIICVTLMSIAFFLFLLHATFLWDSILACLCTYFCLYLFFNMYICFHSLRNFCLLLTEKINGYDVT